MMDHQVLDIAESYEKGATGWDPDHGEIERFCGDLPHQTVGDALAGVEDVETDFHPWLLMLALFLDWKRGAQGIGDCVSWGWELGCFILACMEGRPPAQFATEPIYGGSRVEARGGRLGGYSDGSYGAVAAKWVRDWGVLLRKDYSLETGIAEHNLSAYSSKRAKEYGNYGCGGPKDERGNGKMDMLAREHPVKDVVLVKTADEARRIRKPIPVCSNVGYGQMRRDADGIVRASGRWSHCMLLAGHMKHQKHGWLFRQFQSWGSSCSGPDPAVDALIDIHFARETPEVRERLKAAVKACSWWTTAEDAESQLRQGDSFAVAGLSGWGHIDHEVL